MSKRSFFWASYADLMSSLFFIMLVLFVLTVVMLKKQVDATETEINKIKEIQNAISNIDSTYFVYNVEHKKHILKIDVGFQTNSADITDIIKYKSVKYAKITRDLKNFLNSFAIEFTNAFITESFHMAR